MSWYVAGSLLALRAEINAKYPNRDKTSDGTIGDASHAARASDHNPDWAAGGVVRAMDLDKDGINVQELLDSTIGDQRVEYVIWNRHIYSRTHGWTKRDYTGINPHDHHVHISIRHSRSAETDISQWLPGPITKTEDLVKMEWTDKIKLTSTDAKVWNEWGGVTKYKEGSEVSVGEMLRYPTLLKRVDLRAKKDHEEVMAALKKLASKS